MIPKLRTIFHYSPPPPPPPSHITLILGSEIEPFCFCSSSVLAPLLSLLFFFFFFWPEAVSTKSVFHSYTNALSKVQKVNGRCFAIQGASLTKDLVTNNETASLLLVSCVFEEELGQRLHPSAGYKVTFRQFISGLEKTQSDVNARLSPFQLLTPVHTAKHRPLCLCTKIKALK